MDSMANTLLPESCMVSRILDQSASLDRSRRGSEFDFFNHRRSGSTLQRLKKNYESAHPNPSRIVIR